MRKINYLILLAAGFSTQSHALEYQANLGASIEHSDNILLENTNEQSDTERKAILNFSLTEETSTITADIDYRAEHTNYAEDSDDDQTEIEGTAHINLSLIPEAIAWELNSNTQSLRSDRRDSNTLSNRERRNIISTGPAFSLRASPVDKINLTALYTTTKFEDTNNNDNDRVSGNVNWGHRISASRRTATGATYIETDFDDLTIPDIETTAVYTGLVSTLSNSELSFNIGYNESNRDGFDKVDGPLLEARYNYRSDSRELSIFAINKITDSTIGLGNSSSISDGDITDSDSNFTDIDIVERTYSDIRYTTGIFCSVCSLSGALSYDDQDFASLNNDETSILINLGFNYRFSNRLDAQLDISHETIEFHEDNREDDINFATARLNYNPYPNLAIYLSLRTEERNSNLDSADYDELRGGLGINYLFN